ncbi:MAG: winged-helix phosphate transcriptional response regulator [Verrucomicrobiota bacterium]|jgi:two-component system phosphate regulon response regulator PhoB
MSFSSKTLRKRILVADDEPDVLALLSLNLQRAGFEVLRAEDGERALRLAREENPALVVLDLMMPGLSGLEVAKQLKQSPATAGIPVVMLTAKSEEVDRIVGLELGADDYVTKPFSPREMVLRIQSVLRRTEPPAVAVDSLEVGPIRVDRVRHEVVIGGEPVEFTATEFKLLTVLMERCGRLQSREVLLNDVWGYESVIDTRTVDTHIRRLREKLGHAAELIETVRGFGYRMVVRTE